MARLSSTEPISLLLLHHLRCRGPGSSLGTAFAAATARAHAGTLSPEDAHKLFDGTLRQASPVPKRSLNDFLAAVARAPASDARRDGLALAVALFNRVSACPQVPPPFTDQTYRTLVECCCRDRRPDLAQAFFGRFLKTGLKSEELVANTLRRCLTLSSSTSAFWSPIAAFSAATERARAGMLSPEDAHHLFDRLLGQSIPVAQPFLKRFLAALARAPEGPALAMALFNRLYREEGGLQVAPVSMHTYNIMMDSCCRASRGDLGLAIFGRFLRTGMKTNQNTANAFLKCLCYAKRTDEAVDVLLHRMSELGCAPDPFSYSIVAKGLCDDGRSQQALHLLQMVVKERGARSLDVVVYNTVIHALCNEGQVSKACNLLHEMMQQGVMPNVTTYASIY